MAWEGVPCSGEAAAGGCESAVDVCDGSGDGAEPEAGSEGATAMDEVEETGEVTGEKTGGAMWGEPGDEEGDRDEVSMGEKTDMQMTGEGVGMARRD